MALSLTPEEKITALQGFLEVMDVVKPLLSDSNVLKQLAKDAKGLPEAEQKKADEARDNIDKYSSLIAEQIKRQQELAATTSQQEQKQKSIDSSLEKIDEQNNRILERIKLLDDRETFISNKEQELEISQKDFEGKMIDYQREVKAVVELKQNVLNYETELKARASRLRAETDGL